jgi:hypothetical protein
VAGYAASATLQGATPQFALTSEHARHSVVQATPAALLATGFVGDVDQLDLVGRPIDEVLAEWLASVGESWSQLTFFLFDPESWR